MRRAQAAPTGVVSNIALVAAKGHYAPQNSLGFGRVFDA